MYPVVTVPDAAADSTEQLGTKPKFWFRDDDGRRCLFKQGRPGTGENWAEKVSAELCKLLGMPHAHYDLAVWRDQAGVVSPSFVPADCRLVLGNELLARLVKRYAETRYYQQTGHTVRRVFGVLRARVVRLPASWAPDTDIRSAAHVFVGYLMLDALIGNTDRHHENWGLIIGPGHQGPERRLAPTFDHASSLGRNESEQRMLKRMKTRDPQFSVPGYAKRARSALYRTPRETHSLSTLDAFDEARRLFPGAAAAWIARLRKLAPDDIRPIVDRIPDDFMSATARDFAMQLLTENTARLFQLAETG
ncbi:MAG: HipA domain-containing protein [Geminicoccaceae bacterium]